MPNVRSKKKNGTKSVNKILLNENKGIIKEKCFCKPFFYILIVLTVFAVSVFKL